MGVLAYANQNKNISFQETKSGSQNPPAALAAIHSILKPKLLLGFVGYSLLNKVGKIFKRGWFRVNFFAV